ncbi:hypothetical protein pipiens_013525 [Culex pipiens pipiens]|uniref:C2H2-type domain-containing protein n=1 Tax=Culex pipiens pipiens TaxID=38569 RepID=A0ABD1CUI9_CULPP
MLEQIKLAILAAVEEADSTGVDRMQASRLADTSDQKRGVRTGELTEQELAQLKAAKIPKGRKWKSSDRRDPNRDDSAKENESVLTKLTLDVFGVFEVEDTPDSPEGCDRTTRGWCIRAIVKIFSKLGNVQAFCKECDEIFGTKGALNEHQLTHSDENRRHVEYDHGLHQKLAE